MPWDKLYHPTNKEFKKLQATFLRSNGFPFNKKPKFFVDENLGQGTTELIRKLGGKVTDVWEENFLGHPDENIWRFCKKNQLIILSHDDDFMHKTKFPYRNYCGVVIFPHKNGGENAFIRKVIRCYNFLKIGSGIIWQTKIIIRENNHWEFFRLGDNKKLERNVYNLSDINHAYQLSE